MKGIALEGFLLIREELQRVEAHIRALLASPIPAVAALGRDLQGSGGKRLRPALVALFYKALGEGGDREEVLRLAALLELIHLATLAHDDVIDAAPTRRHQPALHARAGNRKAILEGDFIFSRVFGALNRYPCEVRTLVIETVERVIEGELLQESLRGRLPTEGQYFQVIEGKTASLIAAACALGAWWGDPDLPASRKEQVYRAGLSLGTAFQMTDDLLDLFGDEALGKPTWSDVRGGWFTLPLIRLAQRQGPDGVQSLYRQALTPERQGAVLRQLQRHGLREEVRSEALRRVQEAQAQLAWLPDSELQYTLFQTMDFIAQRDV